VSKIFFRKCRFFTNIFTETPITRSFFNIFSIRFFQCILQVLVHLYWCAKVFYDPSFRRVVKKKNRFRPKTAFFTQLLSRHALTIHFTDTPFLLKHLAFVFPIPTISLNFLYLTYKNGIAGRGGAGSRRPDFVRRNGNRSQTGCRPSGNSLTAAIIPSLEADSSAARG